MLLSRFLQAPFFVFFALMSTISPLHAAAESIMLKMNGVPINAFGKKQCTSGEKVEIPLPPSITNIYSDFKAIQRTIAKPDSKETGCLASLSDERKAAVFTKNKLEIDAKFLLSDAACQGTGDSGTRALCIYEKDGTLVAESKYSFSTSAGKLEKIKDESAVDGEITFTVESSGTPSGQLIYEVCYVKTSEGDIEDSFTDCPFQIRIYKSPKIKIPRLENDVEYGFRVRLGDAASGPGDWSKAHKLTPVPVAFPLANYNGAGGELQFSCDQGGGSSVLLFAIILIALLWVRARNREVKRWSLDNEATILLLFVLLKPEIGHTDLGQMNIGILGAMYRPDLDSEKLSSGNAIYPFYKCFFRKKTSDQNGPINPLMGVEVDFHLWDGFGSLQLGLGLSYTFTPGHALKLNADKEPDCDAPLSNAKVTLHMYQLRPQLTYIFNPFADYFPFVPYIRGALIGHGYMFFKGDKNEPPARVNAALNKPNGFRFGYQGAVGMMLRMDFLEPGAVRSARGQGLFEHVYLKGELSYTKIDSFNRPGFQFSARDVMGTDWPLMWTFGLVFELPH